ncbi:gag-pol polyprotein [Striga asiatica]|uniref:Gag-pol polyprotein n=1 Tax=Striga asiatica TaxID=4170 RepID=A0A5A7R878_STRAF|nr:gag-pol polyprotein [Striga asiatica]
MGYYILIRFQYERLVNLDYYCGNLGHLDRLCSKRLADIENGCLREGQYGDSLKAIVGGSNTRSSHSSSFYKTDTAPPRPEFNRPTGFTRLNPAKCSFEVKSGNFQGYMVTKRGIEVSPEKPVAEKSGPLFRSLRKSSKFQWTEEAQKSFEELQKVLANLPLLAKPVHGEDLVLYISIGETAVSLVLLREEGTMQFPIYYVSRVMQGAKRRYSEVEKCAVAVVATVKKLRPYFLGHKVKVRRNMPLGETLGRPSVSGRLVKWKVELSEYTITYEPRRAIKAQTLADFIQEGTCNATIIIIILR